MVVFSRRTPRTVTQGNMRNPKKNTMKCGCVYQKRMLMEDIHILLMFDVSNGIHFYEGTAIDLIHSDDIAPSVLL